MNPPDIKHSPALWNRFTIHLNLVILLFISALFVGIYLNSQKSMRQELRSRAQALFNSIVLARKWNSMHGGVYVEKTPGMESSPYMENPDIKATNGKTYTNKIPALMTREISELAQRESIFQFRITSLKPLNLNNAPDAFERQALQNFARGSEEEIGKETGNGSTFYRYMAPLKVEQSCLPCHEAQGYRPGEVRGGISVRFNIDAVERAMAINAGLIALLFAVTAGSFLAIAYHLVVTLQRKIVAAEEIIQKLAVTDELTGLKNRRFVLARLAEELDRSTRYQRPLSCIIFDVDHFKRVNDTHGHLAGDKVLQAVGDAAQEQRRQTDIVGRYGGEEFLMVLPETDLDRAARLAERLRQKIENLRTPTSDGREIAVTATFGVTTYTPAEKSVLPDLYGFIKRTDNAMYEGKKAGRNRVRIAS